MVARKDRNPRRSRRDFGARHRQQHRYVGRRLRFLSCLVVIRPDGPNSVSATAQAAYSSVVNLYRRHASSRLIKPASTAATTAALRCGTQRFVFAGGKSECTPGRGHMRFPRSAFGSGLLAIATYPQLLHYRSFRKKDGRPTQVRADQGIPRSRLKTSIADRL